MRGDTGQSDSQFFKTQKILQQKNQQWIDDLDKRYQKEALKVKLSKAVKVERTQTVWQKIKRWFRAD